MMKNINENIVGIAITGSAEIKVQVRR